MFAKLKKQIEDQNNRPGQNKSLQSASLSLNQNNNSSAVHAPVHHSAKSQGFHRRISHTKSTPSSEDFKDDEMIVSQYLEKTSDLNESNMSQSSNDKSSGLVLEASKTNISEIHQLERTFPSDKLHDKPEFYDLLQEMEAELTIERDENLSVNQVFSNFEEETNRKLVKAENQIRLLEAELQLKNSRLVQMENEKSLLDIKEELLTCKKKLTSLENENEELKANFDIKCHELSVAWQQLSSLKKELEIACSSSHGAKGELSLAMKELRVLVTEKEMLTSQLEGTSKTIENLKENLESMKKEKEDLAERHQADLSELQTQMEVAEMDRKILEGKIVDIEKKFEEDLVVIKEEATRDLKRALQEVEEQVKEKNKLLKKQEQKLGDLRKVVQRELSGKQTNASNNNNCSNSSLLEIGHTLLDAEEAYFNNSSDPEIAGDNIARINVTSNETSSFNKSLDLTQDLNFRYLKHVILKFFLSREHEALQLIKVVSMLLRFDVEEEKMIRDTLQWRTSWFRSKPQLPEKGQSAIVVPALY